MKCYAKDVSLSDKPSVSDQDRSRREGRQQIYSLQRQKSLTSNTELLIV